MTPSNGEAELGRGSHPTDLHEAAKAAWEDAKSKQVPAGTYRVEFHVTAENPITGYVAILKQHG